MQNADPDQVTTIVPSDLGRYCLLSIYETPCTNEYAFLSLNGKG